MRTHDDQITDSPNNNLGRKLREEALANSPRFSPLLHARIMQQIQPRSTIVAPTHSRWRIGWTLPASAAAVALLALTVWFHSHRQTAPSTLAMKPHYIPQLAIQFPNLSEPANSPLSLAHYGHLDRDAKAATDYVINQFDIVPSPPARRG
jgi:hypothetical protein